MSRLNMGRYQPEPVTEAEHSALKIEFRIIVILLIIGIVCVAAEPLMDVFCAMLGVR
jgi:hypothetical protein